MMCGNSPTTTTSDILSIQGDLPPGLSEYEIQRRLTIERNHRKLQELGLVSRNEAPQVGARSAAQKQVPKDRTGTMRGARAEGVPLRRSQRTQGQSAPVYKETAVGFDDGGGDGSDVRSRKRARPSRLRPAAAEPGEADAAEASTPRVKSPRLVPPKPGPPDSSRNLECNVHVLMKEYLGRQFPAFGKAAVMEAATKSVPPRFSKMSGVVEWKNSIFLWVNVDEGGGGYTNLFEIDRATAAGKESAPPKGIPSSRNPSSTGAPSPPEFPALHRSSPCGSEGKSAGDGDGGRGLTRSTAAWSAGKIHGKNAVSGRTAQPGSTTRCENFRMTWFAGKRLTAESPLIRRLIDAGSTAIEKVKGEASDRQLNVTASSAAYQLPTVPKTDRSYKEPGDPLRESTPAVSNAAAISTEGVARTLPSFARSRGDSKDASANGSTGAQANEIALSGSVDDTVTEAPTPMSSSAEGDDGDIVLLFCRLPGEPYVFCGRLGYAAHWPDERPVRFAWRLLDSRGLKDSPDFRAITDAAGAEAMTDAK